MDNNTEVKLAGVIEAYREKVPKSGGRMAFFFLEDRAGRVEAIVRPRNFDDLAGNMKEGEAVLLEGKVKVEFKRDDEGNVDDDVPEQQLERKLMVERLTPLGDALRAGSRSRAVRLNLHGGVVPDNDVGRRRLSALKACLAESPGDFGVHAVVRLSDGAEVMLRLPGCKVDPSEALIARIERIFGEKVAELRS
jgi:DNA polymerase-3 subunit alpha